MQRDIMPDFPQPAVQHSVLRISREGSTATHDQLADETPVALVYNGISHAVMLASPTDLIDFAIGFTLSEGIAHSVQEIYDVEVELQEDGVAVEISLASRRMEVLREQRRALTGRTGCGLCGTESLAHVLRPLPDQSAVQPFEHAALHRAMRALARRQPLHRLTGAVHAAAWAARDGSLLHVYEDVGRHNALDKLIGGMARKGLPFLDGFAVITSRASFEMVQKSAMLRIPLLAAVSAPTSLAVRLANDCGLVLAGFVRDDRHVIYADPHHLLTPNSPSQEHA